MSAFTDLSLISLDSLPNSDLPRLTEVIRFAIQLGYEKLGINKVVQTIAVKTGKKDKRDKDEISSQRVVEKIPLELLADIQASGAVCNVRNIRQYTRFSTVLSDSSQFIKLQNDVTIQSHDIISVQPTTQELFLSACKDLAVDIISLDLAESKLLFAIKGSAVGCALKRGIHFEIVYSPMIRDQTARRNIISNATKLVNVCKGKNIIVSSGAKKIWDLRGPMDVCNLSLLFGLSEAQARAAVTSNCRSLLLHAAARKSKGMMTIERISMKTSTVDSIAPGTTVRGSLIVPCTTSGGSLISREGMEGEPPVKRNKLADDSVTVSSHPSLVT